MPQSANLTAGDGEDIHIEEADIGSGLARHFLHGAKGMGALNLVAVSSAAALIDGGPLVALSGGLIAARLYVVFNPIQGGRTAHQVELVFVQVEENRIPNHIAVVIAGNKLLGLVDLEILKAIDGEIGKHFQCVGPLDI